MMFSPNFAEVSEADYVKVQGENIQLVADISIETKQKDMYKKLYEKEQFWGNVKDIVILIAIVVL